MKFKWEPKPDITTFELAQCVGFMIASQQFRITDTVKRAFSELPPEAQRHFTVLEDA